MIPCLINAFNCDECIHPDKYDEYAKLLFANMGKLITFLSKTCKPTTALKKSSDGGSKGGSESDGNQSDASSDMGDLEDLHRPRLNGYHGLTTLLLDEIYLPFF